MNYLLIQFLLFRTCHVIQSLDVLRTKEDSRNSVIDGRSAQDFSTRSLDHRVLNNEGIDKTRTASTFFSLNLYFIYSKQFFSENNLEGTNLRNIVVKEPRPKYIVPEKIIKLDRQKDISPETKASRSRRSRVFSPLGFRKQINRQRFTTSLVNRKSLNIPKDISSSDYQQTSNQRAVASPFVHRKEANHPRVASLVAYQQPVNQKTVAPSLTSSRRNSRNPGVTPPVMDVKIGNRSNLTSPLVRSRRLKTVYPEGPVRRNECVGIKWCDCVGRQIYCDGGGHDLFYIPKIPKNTTEFYFYDNFLPHMSASTFSNLTDVNLKLLTIGNNSLRSCDENVFLPIISIDTLLIESETNISASEFHKCLIGLNRTRLKHLKIADVTLENIRSDFFSGLANSSVESIDIFAANFDMFDLHTLVHLPRLRNLQLINCGIKKVKLYRFKQLRILHLSHNSLSTFPDVCRSGFPLFPKLKSLTLSSNLISSFLLSDIDCLKNLEVLSINYNPIASLPDNMFSDFTKLRHLEISLIGNSAVPIGPLAFNSSTLIYLDFSGPQVLDWYSISRNIFSHCPNLQFLFIDMNNFQEFTDDDFFRLLSPLTELRNLSLELTSLSFLPTVISTHLLKIEYLSFENNRIAGWRSNYFQSLTKLNLLNLAVNKISTLDYQGIFPLLDLPGVVFLDENPYDCSCDLLWFIKLLKYGRIKTDFGDYPESYRCISPVNLRNQRLDEITLTDRYCLLTTRIAVTIVIVLSIVLVTVIVGSIFYRFRWYAKYVAYMVHFDRRRRERLNANRNAYLFDVYLSSSDDDFDFILWRILPVLEDELGLKVYAPHRDGIGCKMDGIVTNMDESRKIVVFLSASYARDHFCEFEARQAYQRSLMEKTNSMIVVLLEELTVMDLSKTLYNTVKTGTYITWTTLPEGERLFWIKLKDQMMDMDDLRP